MLARQLPQPFRPQIVEGYGLAGICLIRLAQVRPAIIPWPVGLRSENAAHRAAVKWDDNGEVRRGVYIWRRDTDLWLNSLAGGRIFPGVHHHSRIVTSESNGRYELNLTNPHDSMSIVLDAETTDVMPDDSVFRSLEEASAFFQAGSVGYSGTSDPSRHQGLELHCENWSMEPLAIRDFRSSFFDDREKFPAGSLTIDSAFLMRGIRHRWRAKDELCCSNF